MILSNREIVSCLEKKLFTISPLENLDPTQKPFNTSAIDLRLDHEILVPESDSPIQFDLRQGNIAKYWHKHSKNYTISEETPYSLPPQRLILAKTLEAVEFPIHESNISYSARVEGRSSLARCGILVHFTAPTIHAGFFGTITLEIINLGIHNFLLSPKMSICQLIIEEVKGSPFDAPNQFKGQNNPAGVI